MEKYCNSREHFFDELHRLDLLLNAQVMRQRKSRGAPDCFRGLFVSEEEIDGIVRPAVESEDPEIAQLLAGVSLLEERIAQKTVAALEARVPLALPALAQLFALNPFDLDALLLCAACELDSKYGTLCGYLQNDVTRKTPGIEFLTGLHTSSLSQRLINRSRLMPEAPLRFHNIVLECGAGFRIDPAIFNYLIDEDSLDEDLAHVARCVTPKVSTQHVLVTDERRAAIERAFQDAVAAERPTLILLRGAAGVGKKSLAEALCKAANCGLIVAGIPQMGSARTPFSVLVARAVREARLRRSALFLDRAEAMLADQTGALQVATLKAIEQFGGVAFLGSTTAWDPDSPLSSVLRLKLDLPIPVYSDRRRIWNAVLEGARVAPDDVDALADRFAFTPGKIRDAFAEAQQLALLRGGTLASRDLYQACRAQSSSGLSALARRIHPVYTWRDLVLPDDELLHLQEMCAHVKHRQKVFGAWGFDAKFSLGKGLAALFVGPSGAGKTMAAEIMANELGLDLYKIDLSCVVSKYIGETEKNLSRIFSEAEQSNAILFFDEADAIFGKRSEVKDSHDRYANTEINYLLQRIEEFSGTVILASNFKQNIDEAFTRRMRFIVEFRFPEEEYRYRIWQNVFPADTPINGAVDFQFLARKLKVTGGSIRNIALHAAFLAANDGGIVGMEQIILSTRREFRKMGRLCVKSDFDGYFDLVKGTA